MSFTTIVILIVCDKLSFKPFRFKCMRKGKWPWQVTQLVRLSERELMERFLWSSTSRIGNRFEKNESDFI